MLTFSPPAEPEVGAGAEITYRARVSQFGDGYEQRVPDGINNQRLRVTLLWRVLSATDANTIQVFFSGVRSDAAFFYTLPWESAPRKFRLDSLSRQATGIARASITAQCVEVFDL